MASQSSANHTIGFRDNSIRELQNNTKHLSVMTIPELETELGHWRSRYCRLKAELEDLGRVQDVDDELLRHSFNCVQVAGETFVKLWEEYHSRYTKIIKLLKDLPNDKITSKAKLRFLKAHPTVVKKMKRDMENDKCRRDAIDGVKKDLEIIETLQAY